MLHFKESSQFQWGCAGPWEHHCCVFFPGIWWPLGMWCHGQGCPKGSECSVAEMFQLLLASGKKLSSRKEQSPKLPKLGNAAHHAGSTQVSTNLKFSINCCVMGNCNMTCWEPSFLANNFRRNNCILLSVANSLPPNSSLVLPCRKSYLGICVYIPGSGCLIPPIIGSYFPVASRVAKLQLQAKNFPCQMSASGSDFISVQS